MGLFWTIMLILSLGLLVTGLIKPSIFARVFGSRFDRKWAGLVFGGILLVVVILGTIFPAKN